LLSVPLHGSTSAAIISLHTVINLLQFNPFVVVISLDFSKAFDTVRHSMLLSKLAELDLPTPVYKRLVDFSAAMHSHHTVFNGDVSRTTSITDSRPASYRLEHWTVTSLSRLQCHSRLLHANTKSNYTEK